MPKTRTGKKVRPRTAVKGKRFRCAHMPEKKPGSLSRPGPVVLSELPEPKTRCSE